MPSSPAAEAEHPLLRSIFRDWPHRRVNGVEHGFLTFEPHLFPMLEEIELAARHDVTVLLTGETGAGKTHLAQLIHDSSPMRSGRFFHVACGALPAELIESELFGHVRGAFTGADREREGKFAAAAGGSLLLDEIDLLSLCQQAKLLRVIETGEYEKVGSNDTQHSTARLIAASNVPPETLVDEGRFREDLFYRLNILRFDLPPLRQRKRDLEYLARMFVVRYSRQYSKNIERFSPRLVEFLCDFHWPGNIRQLDNSLRRAVLFCQEETLDIDHLPPQLRGQCVPGCVVAPAVSVENEGETLAARTEISERQIIVETLRRHNERRTAAARELGISRVTLYNKMKKLGLLPATTS